MTAPSAVVTTSSGRPMMPMSLLPIPRHDAEAIALGIGNDHVVGVRRALVPVHFGGAEARPPAGPRRPGPERTGRDRSGVGPARSNAPSRATRLGPTPIRRVKARSESSLVETPSRRSRAPRSRTPSGARDRPRGSRSSRHGACGRLYDSCLAAARTSGDGSRIVLRMRIVELRRVGLRRITWRYRLRLVSRNPLRHAMNRFAAAIRIRLEMPPT